MTHFLRAFPAWPHALASLEPWGERPRVLALPGAEVRPTCKGKADLQLPGED